MPLNASSLADSLQRLFESKPASSADAAMAWANAYQSYASAALSSAASLPVTAPANFGLLMTAFQGLSAMAPMAAAAIVAQGVTGYWQAMVWAGQKEPAELYWELLKEAGLTMAPLEQG